MLVEVGIDKWVDPERVSSVFRDSEDKVTIELEMNSFTSELEMGEVVTRLNAELNRREKVGR